MLILVFSAPSAKLIRRPFTLMPQAIHFVQARRPFLTQALKLESSYIRVTRIYKIRVRRCYLLTLD